MREFVKRKGVTPAQDILNDQRLTPSKTNNAIMFTVGLPAETRLVLHNVP